MLLRADLSVDIEVVRKHLADVSELRKSGKKVIVVSSGAIACGMAALGLTKRPADIPSLQMCAAVGQANLMKLYGELLPRVAQVLLTHADFQERKRFVNFQNTLQACFERDVVPIINENDTVSVEEIKFGDNDILAAMVSNATNADLTILLSDVEGLFDSDPKRNPEAKKIDVVDNVAKELHKAGKSRSALGMGGVLSKLKAAKIVTEAGGALVLAHGKRASICQIVSGENSGTLFIPMGKMGLRKRWLAHIIRVKGSVTVDEGAAAALKSNGKSLLPVGIVSCTGEFAAGDAIAITDSGGMTIARGISNRSSSEIRLVMGKRGKEEVVHRNNMVIL